MTLRGEIDSFPLETVVQLIHSTSKTGQLEVRGSDGTDPSGGTLGFDDGRLIAAISGEDAGEPALGAIFAVAAGTFEFIPWNDAPAANLAGDLDQLLDKAAEERDRMVAVRRVIPDDRSRFRLSERAAEKGNITLAPDQWRTLLAVNGDRDVPAVADHLKAGKLMTRAALAALVDAGFIDVLAPASIEPAAPVAATSVEAAARPAERVEPDQWTPPARAWAAPVEEAAPALEPAPAPPPEVWQAPAPQRWETAAPALGQSWEQPASDPVPSGPAPSEAPRPDQGWEQPQPDLRADLAAALDARMSAIAPAVEPEIPSPVAPAARPSAPDERLAALSGVFSPAPVEVPPVFEPAPANDRINEWSRMSAGIQAEPAPVEEKKKGLFGFLKRDDAPKDEITDPVMAEVPAASGIGRAGQLAAFSNALLAEYNSGQYGKGRLDDRMANLLMRVDEQADPIDRPLPIVDDRIDAQALDRENMPEQQAVPYLAMLVSQIYEDAERTFGKDKAKRGYRSAQQQVFGSDTSALAAPDLSGRLPKV